MDPKRWKQIDELVDAALDVPDSQRDAFLDSRVGGDQELKTAVLKLIGAQSDSSQFLDQSAMRVVAQAMAEEKPRIPTRSRVGEKIGTYRIERLIGQGGMGEVYLAFDEKMRRNVALKILPSDGSADDERVRRFEMEARAISKLNHPNIVTIYDVGKADGVNYIATEYVEGKTLRELSGGKFKLRNVMANSIQICDALSAAHAAGIIHRDIKPENIMIRDDGYAKILDFGVAKLTEIGPDTLLKFGQTMKGIIVGTPSYMSPRQVSGDVVDHRTDIWSCGVVLYEFLTGQNPFKGENRQQTFEAILTKKPPPASSINPDLPEEIDRILARTMEKDSDHRYQTAADLRADLKVVKRELDLSESGELHSSSSLSTRRSRAFRRPILGYASVATILIVLAAAAVGGYFYFVRGSGPKGPDWSAATSMPITNQVGTEYFPTLSPDGKDIAYAAKENGQYDIFLLRIGGKKPTNLTLGSTKDDTQPAFSPKGDLIAFRSEREPAGIYVIEPSGDNLRRIADFGYHPSFSPDGKQIVVSTFGRDQPTVRAAPGMSLDIIDIQSGGRSKLLDAEATFPSWSPNGHRIAYWFYTGTFGRRDIATIPAGGGEPVIVAKDFAVSNWNPVWSPDGEFLYFVSSRAGKMNFWRVAVDEQTGVVLDDPEPVVTPSSYSRHISFSRDGKRMAYVQTRNTSNIQGVDFDLSNYSTIGEPYWITKGEREIARPELSPDGTRFVLRLIKPTQDDVVTVSRDGTEWRDVTNDEPFDRYVRWSPDGKRLTFASDRNGGGEVWVCNADGTGLKQLTFSQDPQKPAGFPIWSADGTKIAVSYNESVFLIDSSTGQHLSDIPAMSGTTGFISWDWSPDGTMLGGVIQKGEERWVGVYSFASKAHELLAKIPATIPIQWSPDNTHLLWSSESKIKAVDIRSKQVKDILEVTNVEAFAPFISRDGKLLYYSGVNLESDIWLLDLAQDPQ